MIDSLCAVLKSKYVYPDKANLYISSMHANQQKGAYNGITDARMLANTLEKELRAIHNDKHLRIVFDPMLEKDITEFTVSKAGADDVRKKDSVNDARQNFHFRKIEILPANIAYIDITGFARFNSMAAFQLRSMLQFIANTDAVIIDLRNNLGGDGTMMKELADYFFCRKTYTGKTYNRIEDTWSKEFWGSDKKQETGLANIPVCILTSRRTFSAAEGFAYGMQSLGRASIIGDTTRGAAHLTRSFGLGNGLVAFIPFQRYEHNITGTDWEGTGVIPNLSCKEEHSLIMAQQEILQQKLTKTTDDKEILKLQWLINYYTSQTNALLPDPAKFAAAAGRYAEFEITVKNGRLYFRDTNQRSSTPEPMQWIAGNLFQAGKNYQVELIPDQLIISKFSIHCLACVGSGKKCSLSLPNLVSYRSILVSSWCECAAPTHLIPLVFLYVIVLASSSNKST